MTALKIIKKKVLCAFLSYCILFCQIQASYAAAPKQGSQDITSSMTPNQRAEYAKYQTYKDPAQKYKVRNTDPGKIAADPLQKQNFLTHKAELMLAKKQLDSRSKITGAGTLDANKAGQHDYLLKETNVWKSKERREKKSSFHKTMAIYLFWKAVEALKLDEVSKNTSKVVNLTTELTQATANMAKANAAVDQANTALDEAKGQSENQLSSNIGDPAVKKDYDDKISASKKVYNEKYLACADTATATDQCEKDPQIKKYKAQAEAAEAAKKQYILSVFDKKIKNAPTQGARQAAIKEKENYLAPANQSANLQKMEAAVKPQMDQSKQAAEASDAAEDTATAKGEELYGQQEKVNKLINRGAINAIKLANQAKQESFKLARSKGGSVEMSKKAMGDLLQNLKGDQYAMDAITQLAVTSSAIEHLECVKVGQVDSPSYHLFQAASAIYLASQMRQVANFNDNLKDIKDYDPNREGKGDEQLKIMGKAAGVRFESVDTAKIRLDNKDTLMRMYNAVLAAAHKESEAEKARQEAAAAQAKKANERKKGSGLKLLLAIGVVALAVFIYFNWEAINISTTPCAGTEPTCTSIFGISLSQKAIWAILLGIALAFMAWRMMSNSSAKKEQGRANNENNKALKHGHLRCQGKGVNLSQKLPIQSPTVLSNVIVSILSGANAETNAVTDSKMLNTETMHSYYLGAKKTALAGDGNNVLGMVKGFETPTTRVQYLSSAFSMSSLNVSGLQNIVSQNEEVNKADYKALYNDMNKNLALTEEGQPIGDVGKTLPGNTTASISTPENCSGTGCSQGTVSSSFASSKNVALSIGNRKGSTGGVFKQDKRDSRALRVKSNSFSEKAAKSISDRIKKYDKKFEKKMIKSAKRGTSLYKAAQKATINNISKSNPNLAKVLKQNFSMPSTKMASLGSYVPDQNMDASVGDDYDDDFDDDQVFNEELDGEVEEVWGERTSQKNAQNKGTISGRGNSIFLIITDRYMDTAYPVFFRRRQ